MSLSEKAEESTLGHSDLEAEPQDIEKQKGIDQEVTGGTVFPEGGLQAWLTLFGAFLMQFCTFGYTNAFGVYQDFYVREYLKTYNPSDIGWIGGTQIFLIFGCGIFSGRMFDKGYFHHLMISGALLHSFSFFMLSLSKENQYYQVFLSQGLGGGLASGIVFIPSVSVVSHFFQKNRPFAMGVVACGVALGAVTHPILLNQLFHGPIGFHNGVRISAALNTVLMLVANLIMRTRLPPSNQGDYVQPIEFAKDLPYMAIATGSFLVVCGIFFPSFFLQLDAIEHGVNSDLAFYFLPILNGASIFGRVIPTYYAPRVGALNMLTFFTFCMGILLFCMVRIRDAVGFGVFAAIFGFISGAAISLTPPVLAGMARNIGELGARIGVSFATTGIIGLFATPIAGALLTPKFIWWRAITFCGATMLAGGVSLLLARSSLVRQRKTRIV